MKQLQKAIDNRVAAYRCALDTLRDASDQFTGPQEELGAATWQLREAIELANVLRRALPELTVQQVHKAFGAPGDFGYETPVGEALAELYRCESFASIGRSPKSVVHPFTPVSTRDARLFSLSAAHLANEFARQAEERAREWYESLPEPRPDLTRCEALYPTGEEIAVLSLGEWMINPNALPTFRVAAEPGTEPSR